VNWHDCTVLGVSVLYTDWFVFLAANKKSFVWPKQKTFQFGTSFLLGQPTRDVKQYWAGETSYFLFLRQYLENGKSYHSYVRSY